MILASKNALLKEILTKERKNQLWPFEFAVQSNVGFRVHEVYLNTTKSQTENLPTFVI